jgi:predicted transcriptional regulator
VKITFKMSTIELKMELIKRLETYENAEFLEAILRYMASDQMLDERQEMTLAQQKLVEIGLAEHAEGLGIANEDLNAEIEAWLAE